MAKKKKWYVVWEGNTIGVFDNWPECLEATKGYPGAKYKSFTSKEAAEEAYNGSYKDYIQQGGGKKSTPNRSIHSIPEINMDSIAVDAACSGNPGKMEYRGVVTETGDLIFHQGPFKKGTNNVGEFLALVHGIAYLKKIGDERTVIYTDSKIAMGWVTKKKCNTKLARTRENAPLFALVERAEKWLKSNTYPTELVKWNTEEWGEIPADFGRK